VHFMTDYYVAVLLITLLGAGLYLWRGGTTRRTCTLLIGVSAVWWLAMLGLRAISHQCAPRPRHRPPPVLLREGTLA
jgi:hypothetical protein